MFARARFGRAVWLFVTWVEPLLAAREGRPSAPRPDARARASYARSAGEAAVARLRAAPTVAFGESQAHASVLVDPSLADASGRILDHLRQGVQLLGSAHMSFVAELTVGAVEIVPLPVRRGDERPEGIVALGEQPTPLEYAFALLDGAALEWMRLATWADEVRLREQRRWREARPNDVALAADAFRLALEFEFACSEAVRKFDREPAERWARRVRTLLEAAARPLAELTHLLPPLPLTKDFAVATYPLWDALEFQWRDCHTTRVVRTRLRELELELKLDGVLT